jgi:hypothetical protein
MASGRTVVTEPTSSRRPPAPPTVRCPSCPPAVSQPRTRKIRSLENRQSESKRDIGVGGPSRRIICNVHGDRRTNCDNAEIPHGPSLALRDSPVARPKRCDSKRKAAPWIGVHCFPKTHNTSRGTSQQKLCNSLVTSIRSAMDRNLLGPRSVWQSQLIPISTLASSAMSVMRISLSTSAVSLRISLNGVFRRAQHATARQLLAAGPAVWTHCD